MKIDNEARYLKTHEWVRKEDTEMVMGISDYAQSTLSDIVYVELPEVGDSVSKGDQIIVVESVKAAADVYAPLSGEITAVNETLEDEPEMVNQAAFGAGWLIRIKPSDPTEWEQLLTAEAYKKVAEEEAKH